MEEDTEDDFVIEKVVDHASKETESSYVYTGTISRRLSTPGNKCGISRVLTLCDISAYDNYRSHQILVRHR